MEVLNQNQRRSAFWRISAIALLILALFGTSLFSMHKQYAAQGKGEYETLKNKYTQEKLKWQGIENGLKNNLKRLKAELKKCQDNNNPEERLEICKENLAFKEDQIRRLQNDLNLCESKLQAATAY